MNYSEWLSEYRQIPDSSKRQVKEEEFKMVSGLFIAPLGFKLPRLENSAREKNALSLLALRNLPSSLLDAGVAYATLMTKKEDLTGIDLAFALSSLRGWVNIEDQSVEYIESTLRRSVLAKNKRKTIGSADLIYCWLRGDDAMDLSDWIFKKSDTQISQQISKTHSDFKLMVEGYLGLA